MGYFHEGFNPHPMTVNDTARRGGSSMGGFLAVTSGTLTVTANNTTTGGAANILVNAVPVTAGVYLPIPLLLQISGGFVVTLAGGASGTLFV